MYNQSPSGKYHFNFLNFLTIYHYTLLMIGKGKGKPKANVMGKSKGKGNAAVAVKYVELKPNLCVALRTVFYYSADPP